MGVKKKQSFYSAISITILLLLEVTKLFDLSKSVILVQVYAPAYKVQRTLTQRSLYETCYMCRKE